MYSTGLVCRYIGLMPAGCIPNSATAPAADIVSEPSTSSQR